MKTRILILAALTLTSGFLLTSCKENTKEATTTAPEATEASQVTEATKAEPVNLTLVSEGYATKEDGSDWVKINITSLEQDQVTILVTSREDIKKPTCSLETVATQLNDHTYQAILQEVPVNFTLKEGELSIDTVNESDRGILSYYCSGGGSLVGSYKALN
ncbi:hypothetical protein [Myroides odoratus]|uniref:BACON domain-containing protein n=1 Tax=Myroides odoratus TaxID=256 RepID=A0A9Q6ZCK1_MYROD|nr:hypothetical protein [Myroides odoratus]QQU00171.1 hypothetical protein I6I88_18745 [Myroides odoratus]